MTKIYHSKGRIHPSPPPSAAVLLPEEREVLCYLLTSNKSSKSSRGDHRPVFHCDCFECYTSYWATWDTSPNRHVIHQILEAYEDELLVTKNKKKRKNKNKNNSKKINSSVDVKVVVKKEMSESSTKSDLIDSGVSRGDDVALEKGPVRKIVGFLGERIWGVWGK